MIMYDLFLNIWLFLFFFFRYNFFCARAECSYGEMKEKTSKTRKEEGNRRCDVKRKEKISLCIKCYINLPLSKSCTLVKTSTNFVKHGEVKFAVLASCSTHLQTFVIRKKKICLENFVVKFRSDRRQCRATEKRFAWHNWLLLGLKAS